ncbi:hypothetical protein COT65_01115 [Candidatus Shapirobacteria bacterium CG09_land_8_20_14_0_10_47_13]|uniref:(S)-ureidoglycine aminohydrolase cupin domain-containing protein n=1 Tax=Candidatus Shapirobacteria bacterium CG09_land_8_20_14_0_10_47_13 TaxID=1974481 RepID=A0A2H0WN16_9BACT|nr:MAG: hypothetical protein COT65_01115 [Candidatus Shapirobacteria bacterium CG09_land_8_20_14_0_10_47_13]
MKEIHREDAHKFQNSPVCAAFEYPLGDRDINGAVIELTGRYPDKGRVVNLRCKELAYIVQGSGKLVVEGKEVELKQGDLVLVEPGERYFWDGKMTMFVPCAPAWTPEQHREVE